MSEEGKNENENGQEEGSMNIYDDNAYMFGDDPSGNNSENEYQDFNKMDIFNKKHESENEEEANNIENKEHKEEQL